MSCFCWREDILGIDCEMVGVAGLNYDPANKETMENALCRVSLVSSLAPVRNLDIWVEVEEPIVDFRTAITGIDKNGFANKKKLSFSEARDAVLGHIAGNIVVGHALWNDFNVLKISHPAYLVRDTALYVPLRPAWRRERLPSLRLLVKHWLDEDIQHGNHDSTIDAAAALRIYKMHQAKWDGCFGNAVSGASVTSAGPCVVPQHRVPPIHCLPAPSPSPPSMPPLAEGQNDVEEALESPPTPAKAKSHFSACDHANTEIGANDSNGPLLVSLGHRLKNYTHCTVG